MSSLKVAKALREVGAEVLGVVAIFSYELTKTSVEYVKLTNYSVLVEEAVASETLHQDDVEKLLEWRNQLS